MWGAIGFVGHSMSGPVRLSASEVIAWQQGTARTLDPWEFNTVRDMSSAYLAGLAEGEDPAAVAPFGAIDQEYDREVVSRKVSSIFGALARKPAP